MKIYMLAEQNELDEIAAALVEQIESWLQANPGPCQLVSPGDEAFEVGLILETSKKIALKEPVNFLYTLAKEYKAEFVVGMINEDGSREDVCFFGFEEGRPDINEIGQYLGLKR